MNCIDAIEGTVKSILTRICTTSDADAMDMSDYIRRVQTVLEATRSYVADNPEITPDPEVLTGVLYDHAKEKWIDIARKSPEATDSNEPEEETIEYLSYCFDYLFTHGTYPL
jgi:hypothetical protein